MRRPWMSYRYILPILVSIRFACGRRCSRLVAEREPRYITSHEDFGALPYPHGIEECWKVTTGSDSRGVMVTPVTFELEDATSSSSDCAYDFVHFHCGRNGEDGDIGRYCGTQLQESLYSSGRRMYVTFVTDNNLSATGFNISYQSYPSGRHKPSCKSPPGIALGRLIGFIFIGIIGVCALVSIWSCCVKNNNHGFMKCGGDGRLCRRNTVHPCPADTANQMSRPPDDVTDSRCHSSPRNNRWCIAPPPYSQVVDSNTMTPYARPPPALSRSQSANQIAADGVRSQYDSRSDSELSESQCSEVTDATSCETRERTRDETRDGTRDGTPVEASDRTRGRTHGETRDTMRDGTRDRTRDRMPAEARDIAGGTTRPYTAEYARPPPGDPCDVRDYILPNSPPPPYEHSVC